MILRKRLMRMLSILAISTPLLLLVTLIFHLRQESVYKDSHFPEDCYRIIPPTGCEWAGGRKGKGEPRIVIPNQNGRVLIYTGGARVEETEINGLVIRTGDILDEDLKGWR